MTSTTAPARSEYVWLDTFADVHDVLMRREGFVMASYDAAKELVFDNVLITLDGSDHLKRRRLESPLVRPAAVARLEADIAPGVARREIDAARKDGDADLVSICTRVATAIAAHLVGLNEGMSSEGALRLAQLMRGLHLGATIQYTRRRKETVVRDVLEAKDAYIREFFIPNLERRRSGQRREGMRNDLLEFLLQAQALDPGEWTDGRIACESIHYLVAAGGTTALSVVAAMDELFSWWALHPADRERMHQDVELLRRAVHEAIRLHPPSAYAMRTAAEDVELASGKHIPSGTLVALDLRRANLDTKAFGADATTFAPDRTDRIAAAGYGLASGAGPHLCMGKRLAGGSAHGEGESALGTVTRIVRELAGSGIQPDPRQQPTKDTSTDREPYLTFPIVFGTSDFTPCNHS